jgi:hypothetical protein
LTATIRSRCAAAPKRTAQALGEDWSTGSTTEVAKANARLIAAAPDLLTAIWKLLLGPAHPDWASHVEEARAAMAKAVGK